ncbi:hypothetical protein ACFL5P_00550 [candidate division KSB1 bacterium]
MRLNSIWKKFLCLFLLLPVLYLPAYSQRVPDISPEEFTNMIISMSEYGGYFSSDNWVTNEVTYLDVIKPLEKLKIEGGVYMGVASNQNFTYIAAIRPELVFFVDIRHMNRMQHLVYKILFEESDTRAEFFSLLFSKPLGKEGSPGKDTNVDEIVNYFYRIPSNAEMLQKTCDKIIKTLKDKYKYPLETADEREIDYVLRMFHTYNLDITYQGYYTSRSRWPRLSDLMRTTDFEGDQLNAFNSRDKFLYIKELYHKNRIIPLTGNFAGTKAIRAVAEYLKAHDLTVTAYYVSNVENYLFRDGIFRSWVNNVKQLPITDQTVFIRWTHDQGWQRPQQSRLQYMKTFIKNYDSGRYYSYDDLKYYDYIKYER